MKNEHGSKLRLFIALEIPPQVRGKLAAIQEKLRIAEARVKWVKPRLIHLTLKFLGNVPPEKVETLGEALRTIIGPFVPFAMEISDVGTFPPGRRARVVWAGVKKGAEVVCELAEAVEQGLIPFGFPVENRRFRPHLTIGRIKSVKQIGRLLDLLKLNKAKKFGRFQVKSVALIQSVLTPAGPEYTVLKNCPLGSTDSEVDDTHGEEEN